MDDRTEEVIKAAVELEAISIDIEEIKYKYLNQKLQ